MIAQLGISRGWGNVMPEYKLAGIAFLSFVVWKAVADALGDASIWTTFIPMIAAIVICAAIRGPSNADVAPSLRIIVRVIAVILGPYALAARLTYPRGAGADIAAFLTLDVILGVTACIAALLTFRWPAFVLVPAAALMGKKAAGEELFDVRISHTDYLPVLELGLFFGLSLLLMNSARSSRFGSVARKTDPERYTVLLFVLGVAIHFSNYFYSGLQKLTMDGGILLWPLHNDTAVLTLNAWVGGFLPTIQWPNFSMFVYRASDATVILLNITILVGQLGALLFVMRRRTMIAVTLFYDLTHVIIFLVSGIFFWKWILLNLGLVAAMRTLPSLAETRAFAGAAMTTVLLAPVGFGIVWLGWYDTNALVTSSFHAVTKDGRSIEVPSNFFGTISVTQAQHRLGRLEEGHYPTVTWGSTQRSEDVRKALNGCKFIDDTPWRFRSDQDKVGRILGITHAYALEQQERFGRYAYDAFPHHIWSNLFIFNEFATLDLREIDYYVYRTQSACVSAGENGPLLDVDFIGETEFRPSGEVLHSSLEARE